MARSYGVKPYLSTREVQTPSQYIVEWEVGLPMWHILHWLQGTLFLMVCPTRCVVCSLRQQHVLFLHWQAADAVGLHPTRR